MQSTGRTTASGPDIIHNHRQCLQYVLLASVAQDACCYHDAFEQLSVRLVIIGISHTPSITLLETTLQVIAFRTAGRVGRGSAGMCV